MEKKNPFLDYMTHLSATWIEYSKHMMANYYALTMGLMQATKKYYYTSSTNNSSSSS